MDLRANKLEDSPVKGDFIHVRGDFLIKIDSRFESSHYLYHYFPDGSDEPLHGHSWQVELLISRKGGGVGEDGISYDFVKANEQLKILTDRLDHTNINTLPEFSGINPTTENIIRFLYAGLTDVVDESGGVIREIRLHEGPNFSVTFSPV